MVIFLLPNWSHRRRIGFVPSWNTKEGGTDITALGRHSSTQGTSGEQEDALGAIAGHDGARDGKD